MLISCLALLACDRRSDETELKPEPIEAIEPAPTVAPMPPVPPGPRHTPRSCVLNAFVHGGGETRSFVGEGTTHHESCAQAWAFTLLAYRKALVRQVDYIPVEDLSRAIFLESWTPAPNNHQAARCELTIEYDAMRTEGSARSKVSMEVARQLAIDHFCERSRTPCDGPPDLGDRKIVEKTLWFPTGSEYVARIQSPAGRRKTTRVGQSQRGWPDACRRAFERWQGEGKPKILEIDGVPTSRMRSQRGSYSPFE